MKYPADDVLLGREQLLHAIYQRQNLYIGRGGLLKFVIVENKAIHGGFSFLCRFLHSQKGPRP